MVPTLAVLCAFRKGRTLIRNVSHLRLKESNRIESLVCELRKIGARAEETESGLTVEGTGRLHGAAIETYNDHRIAMSFAVAGLAIPGIRIGNPECVGKSFPGFWHEIGRLTV
jgi:3-phosphoshikimate 1-carboxyvinyltransferase